MRASRSTRSGSRRSPACTCSAKTSRVATTSAPRCTTPTACRSRPATSEWIWRPLVNPRRLLVTSFATRDPHGFGLMQRDRSPASYEDPEALYEQRPSAWVEPTGNWGERPGRAGADPDPGRDQRQHRRLLGAQGRAAARQGVRLRLPHALATARRRARPARLGRADRGAAAASPGSPTATSISSSISTAPPCAPCARARRSSRSSGSTTTARCASATCSRTGSPAPGA